MPQLADGPATASVRPESDICGAQAEDDRIAFYEMPVPRQKR
jgi:hypothetical protein